MKNTLKLWILALVMTLSVAACKKKDNPQPIPPVEVKTITITDLRALSTGASVKVPDGRKVKGVVISDASAKNIDVKTVVLQEATDKPGIIVTFDAAQTFALGDEVELTISNQTLAQVSGEIVLQNIPAANAKKTGTGTITARTTTIADITTNKAAWDGTLVTIADGMFSGNGKFTGTLTYGIGNGTIKSAIIGGAVFENTDYPALIPGLTGIVRVSGNDVFLNIRNAADVKQPASFVYVEDFSGAQPGIYSPLNSLTTSGLKPYSRNPATALVTKYPAAFAGGGSALVINQTTGVTAINVIKNLSAGSTDADASFLNTGRNYYCVQPLATAALFTQLSDPSNARFGQEWNYLSSSIKLLRQDVNTDYFKNLKNITIVFAGSKMQLSDFDPSSTVTTSVQTNNFDAAKDGFAAYLYTNIQEKIDASPVYNTQGQWHTVTFKDIYSKLSELDKDANGFRSTLYLNFGSKVNPYVTFKGGFNSTLSYAAGSPIVIDKIIFEFSEKPAWAN